MRIILTLICFLTLLNTYGINLISSSYYKDLYNIGAEIKYTNTFLRISLDQKNELLFLIEGKNKDIYLVFGDIFVNFGRGLILGNPKYYYFTRHIYEFRLNTNTYHYFNYYTRDRNYDGIEDILRGFSLRVNQFLTLFSLTDEKLSFSNTVAGAILKILDTDILITKIDNIFISLDFKEINLLNAGVTIDFEGGIRIQNKPNFGIGVLIEWNYKKLEVALEGRTATSDFYTPLSQSLFSKSNKKNGIIISSKVKEEKYLFSLANKLLTDSIGGIENEFYLFLGYKVLKGTFLDVEIIKDYYQGKTFFSIYPYLELGDIKLYVKPILSVDETANFNLEIGSRLKLSSINIKNKLLLPLNLGEDYFITSTDIRDIFGENLDIVSSTINDFNILISVNSELNWLEFEFGANISVNSLTFTPLVFFIFKAKIN